MVHYTSVALTVLASMKWMADNGYDDESIKHQLEVSGTNMASWRNSLEPVGFTTEVFADYVAEILGW